MSALKVTDTLAIRLIMTDDLYLIDKQAEPVPSVIEVISPEARESEHVAAPAFNYLGENNKFILILVNDEDHKILNPADLTSLTKILAAKKSEIRDVAILNLHKHPESNFETLKQFFSCSKLVLFGMNPRKLGLPDISNNEIIVHEGTKILATYSFAEMGNDTNKKTLFWNVMKQL